MPISHNHKAIFIHIPKTAGTSVEKVLGIGGEMPGKLRSHRMENINGVKFAPQHYTASMLKEHPYVKEFWNDYFKFSVVRHPYTRVLSEWFWVRGKTAKGLKWNSKKFTIHLSTFYEKLNNDHKLPQATYLYENDECLVDRVFRFENLLPINTVLKRRCNVKKILPHIQKSSNKPDYVKELTKAHKDFIYEIYKDDFEKFNYQR
tara:strand:- start:1852 stop:2463 length:612 start_codon:yes stop_codon:yes gene_type:complete